jgi:hypothetical protein
VWGGEPEIAGNGDAITALDQKRMEATVKQDFATLVERPAHEEAYQAAS